MAKDGVRMQTGKVQNYRQAVLSWPGVLFHEEVYRQAYNKKLHRQPMLTCYIWMLPLPNILKYVQYVVLPALTLSNT